MTKRLLSVLAWAVFTITAGWLCFGAISSKYVGPGILGKQVPAWFSIQSYPDAVHLIRERTGLSVSCPRDLEELMNSAPVAGAVRGEPPDKEGSTREFLNHMVRCKLGLEWRLDAENDRIELDLPWRKTDARTPAELLQSVWQRLPSDSPDWHSAFDALLSKPGNFEKAWRVRQFARYQSLFRNMEGERLWVGRVISETQHPLVVVVVRHRIHTYPGRGAVSCYAFREDGTLQWADLADSGWRCDLTQVAVDLSSTLAGPSEMRWAITANLSSTYTARFRFTGNGIRWIGTTNSNGEEAGLQLGTSLLPHQPAS